MQLDLASLKSVRSFAENFLKSEARLDLLINNAGQLFVLTVKDVWFCVWTFITSSFLVFFRLQV